jgi:hypothetical protein
MRLALGEATRYDAATLRYRQYVKLINPTFTKCNNPNEFLIIEVTPEFKRLEHTLSEKPSIFVWRVIPRKRRESIIERYSMDGRSSIHVFQFKLPEHPVFLKSLPIANFIPRSRGMSLVGEQRRSTPV